MDEDALRELRIIKGLLLAQLSHALQQDGAQRRDEIALLSNAGLEPRDIAAVLGVTPNSVSVALVKLRKEGRVHTRT